MVAKGPFRVDVGIPLVFGKVPGIFPDRNPCSLARGGIMVSSSLLLGDRREGGNESY